MKTFIVQFPSLDAASKFIKKYCSMNDARRMPPNFKLWWDDRNSSPTATCRLSIRVNNTLQFSGWMPDTTPEHYMIQWCSRRDIPVVPYEKLEEVVRSYEQTN